MFAAVIPAQNEENKVNLVIDNLLKLPLDLIIPVINGCRDQTLASCMAINSSKIHIIFFQQALGIDIPRAIGAYYAWRLGAQGVLLIDGDMVGPLKKPLELLINSILSGTDCALTNCYPYIVSRHFLAKKVLKYRELLNRKMDLFHQLGLASPSHGPHAISRRLLEKIPITALAVPPVEIALARQKGLKIEVAAAVQHRHLGSTERSRSHPYLVAQTIIGDCIEALALLDCQPRHRSEVNIIYEGYNPQRRFDLLQDFVRDITTAQII